MITALFCAVLVFDMGEFAVISPPAFLVGKQQRLLRQRIAWSSSACAQSEQVPDRRSVSAPWTVALLVMLSTGVLCVLLERLHNDGDRRVTLDDLPYRPVCHHSHVECLLFNVIDTNMWETSALPSSFHCLVWKSVWIVSVGFTHSFLRVQLPPLSVTCSRVFSSARSLCVEAPL